MYLQVGAFGERGNAERMKAELDQEFGAEITIFAEPPAAPQLYKVQLGPIRDVAHADRVVAALESHGINEHHFVNH
jgi:rare lipoprotein A